MWLPQHWIRRRLSCRFVVWRWTRNCGSLKTLCSSNRRRSWSTVIFRRMRRDSRWRRLMLSRIIRRVDSWLIGRTGGRRKSTSGPQCSARVRQAVARRLRISRRDRIDTTKFMECLRRWTVQSSSWSRSALSQSLSLEPAEGRREPLRCQVPRFLLFSRSPM